MSITISGRHFFWVFLLSSIVASVIGLLWLNWVAQGQLFASPPSDPYIMLGLLVVGFYFLTPSLILTLILYGVFYLERSNTQKTRATSQTNSNMDEYRIEGAR